MRPQSSVRGPGIFVLPFCGGSRGEGNQVMNLQLIGTEAKNRGRCRQVQYVPGLPSPGGSPRWENRIPYHQATGTNRQAGGTE
jgi:hypothetical protein